MIKINRDPTTPPIQIYTETHKRYTSPKDGVTHLTRAAYEKERAILYFESNYRNEEKIDKRKDFTFKVYKDPELVELLNSTFNHKCAYCESRFAHVTPTDVEHFRPKKEIYTGDATLKPGYYWLAADWNNLLVSCADCNRSRKHEVPDESTKMNLGKLTQFPLTLGAPRARKHTDDISIEEDYLLLVNPCLEEPSMYFTFDEKGLIHPQKDDKYQPLEKGVYSIKVYALQRKFLVEERERVLKEFKFQVQQLTHLISVQEILISVQEILIEANATNMIQSNLAEIEEVSAHLKDLTNEKAPYLAMLREYIKTASQASEYDKLKEFGIDLEKDLIPT